MFHGPDVEAGRIAAAAVPGDASEARFMPTTLPPRCTPANFGGSRHRAIAPLGAKAFWIEGGNTRRRSAKAAEFA